MQMPSNEPVTFQRDCEAVLIPAGDTVEIPVGTHGNITQALGGSFTVYIAGNLIRIGETTLRFVALCGKDFDWTASQEDKPRHVSFG